MKTWILPSLVVIGLCVCSSVFAGTERTADALLSNPTAFEGKAVTLDVSFLKPVHFKSPVPGIVFFHAMTVNRGEWKPGGNILVAINESDREKMVKKYGTDLERRGESDILKGTFLVSPGRRPDARVYFVDTTGKAADLIKESKLALEEEGPMIGQRPMGPPQVPGSMGEPR